MKQALPFSIEFLADCDRQKYPVNPIVIDAARKVYPQYWNSLGEFDPYFKRRNPIINFIRRQIRNYRLNKRIKNIMKYAK